MNEKGIEPPKGLEIDPQTQPRLLRWFQLLWSNFPKQQTFSATLDPTSVPANSTSEQTFSLNGVTTQDIVTVSKPTHTTGLGIANCRVSAANTLAITFMNNTGSAIDPPTETYLIHTIRR